MTLARCHYSDLFAWLSRGARAHDARCLLLILSFGKPAQDELLCQVGCRALARSDKEIPQEQSDTAIRWRIVGIRESSGGQVTAYSRVVRLPPSVVSLANEWAGKCVDSARPICARALVEIARVLVQERRQDGAADHNVG